MARHCTQALSGQSQLSFDSSTVLELSVQLLGKQSMQALNRQYRQKDAPTNVLSFESGMPALQQADGKWLLQLGDLVFCPELIATEALEQNKSLRDHWAHLLVHGTLHLCGFDHQEPAQATLMESLEIQILSGSGIPDPYKVQALQ